MITENLSTLKINKLKSQEQYDKALAEGKIHPNEIYLTPDEPSTKVKVGGEVVEEFDADTKLDVKTTLPMNSRPAVYGVTTGKVQRLYSIGLSAAFNTSIDASTIPVYDNECRLRAKTPLTSESNSNIVATVGYTKSYVSQAINEVHLADRPKHAHLIIPEIQDITEAPFTTLYLGFSKKGYFPQTFIIPIDTMQGYDTAGNPTFYNPYDMLFAFETLNDDPQSYMASGNWDITNKSSGLTIAQGTFEAYYYFDEQNRDLMIEELYVAMTGQDNSQHVFALTIAQYPTNYSLQLENWV